MFRNCLVAMIFSVLTGLGFGQEKITGVVVPIPVRHFQGSPAKDWPVTKIHVKVGDQVSAGDCLVELDPAMLPQQKAQAEWDSAKLHLNVIKSRLETRKIILGRNQRLFEKRAVSEQEVDECSETVEVLKCELVEAEARERAACVGFRMAKYDYDNYQQIFSPINGEVVAINCSLGLVARATDKQLVWVEVIDSTRVHIHCSVSPQSATVFRRLMDKKTELCLPGTNLKANVIAVPRLIRDGKIAVILEADNPNHELVCGQEVEISLP